MDGSLSFLEVYLTEQFRKLCDDCLNAQKLFDRDKNVISLNFLFEEIYNNIYIKSQNSFEKFFEIKEFSPDEWNIIVKYLLKKFINPPVCDKLYDYNETSSYIEDFLTISFWYLSQKDSLMDDNKFSLDLILSLINEFSYLKITDNIYDYDNGRSNFSFIVNSQIFEVIIADTDPNFVKIHLPSSGDIFDMSKLTFFDMKIPLTKCKDKNGPLKEIISKGLKKKNIWKKVRNIDGYYFLKEINGYNLQISYTNGIVRNKAFYKNYMSPDIRTFRDDLIKLKKNINYLREIYNVKIDIDNPSYYSCLNNILTKYDIHIGDNVNLFIDKIITELDFNRIGGIRIIQNNRLNVMPRINLELNLSVEEILPESFEQKYLKYKQKYLQLKKLMREKIEHL